MYEDLLLTMSNAVNNLRFEMDYAEVSDPDIQICSALVYPASMHKAPEIHLLFEGWNLLRGPSGDYHVAACDTSENNERTFMDQTYMLWFIHDDVKYFCLLTGRELKERALPVPGMEK